MKTTPPSHHSETGHAPNADNFRKLIDYALSYGNKYAPIMPSLQVQYLTTVYGSTIEAIHLLDVANAPYIQSLSRREEAFAPIAALASRVLRFAETLPINKSTLNALKELVRKLQGRRAKAKDPELEMKNADDAPHHYISVSQLSFAQRIVHFEGFIDLLENESVYQPNEEPLTVAALKNHLADMRATNDDVTQKEIPLHAARNHRDELMYAPETGMIDLALAAKKYIYAAFGSASEEYRNIKGLTFTKKRY
jgi:hypothetical protein